MCQEAVRRLCNPSESCHVRKVARLLARPLSLAYRYHYRAFLGDSCACWSYESFLRIRGICRGRDLAARVLLAMSSLMVYRVGDSQIRTPKRGRGHRGP